jgi:hypothetical protein
LSTDQKVFSDGAMPKGRKGSEKVNRPVIRGLIVWSYPLEQILRGSKTWEIRSRAAHVRGRIGLIESGSGTVVGTCELVGCKGPLTREQRRTGARRAGFPRGEMIGLGAYAWVLKDARRLKRPVRYRHPRGAITWVKLNASVRRRLPGGR